MTELLLVAPVTTPFDAAGEVALDRLRAQLEIYEQFRLGGVVVLGTSGEGPLIDPGEEAPLLEVVRESLSPERRMIVQIGRESVRASRAAARRAIDAGADALLCLPPRYFALGPDVVARHFRAVAEIVTVPLLAYHIPVRSKVDMSADQIAGLAREGVLAGIKDSAGDLELERRLLAGAGADFLVLCGKASVTAAALAAGAHGAILAVADVVPERVLALFEAHAAGDADGAEVLQRDLLPIAEICGPRYGVAGIKAALDLRGWPGGGALRAPLVALDEDQKRDVADALQRAGVAA